ncbi:MAG TPA: von Willebrand factor type A domain-containing protein, partial [Kofleriaceae bacterium]
LRARRGVTEGMQRTIARSLLALLLVTGCSSHETPPNLSMRPVTETATRETAIDDPPPPDIDESGGTGTAMALEEGAMGNADSDRAEGQYKMQHVGEDPQLARQQAIDQARNAGMLGTATGFGSIGTGRYGTIGHGSGTGSGYGAGGGRGGMRGRGQVADPVSTENYAHVSANGWVETTKDHLSTFAADVDTASYTLLRRKLDDGERPAQDAVRVEEMVNYFHYAYPDPSGNAPFAVTTDLAPDPLTTNRVILRVGVSTKALEPSQRPPAHLVFLVDVSGSMQGPDRLPLAQRALRYLVDNLHDGDTVALVTYAGDTRLVLPATPIKEKNKILSAIEDLTAGGSTAMASGLDLAYREAVKGVGGDAISRVIVLSDGDANVGTTGHAEMLKTIISKVKEGVTLSTIGFGVGNYNDKDMEQLADKGNGNNYFVDGVGEAKRVFQTQLGATLGIVAKDVKLQVDFDPEKVMKYRLVGYENRDIQDADFRNDKVDAGEIGPGHQVTALYEVEMRPNASTDGLATVRVRHKAPKATVATEAAFPVVARLAPSFDSAPSDLRFAFAVAAFADVMRGGKDASQWQLSAIRTLAAGAAGNDDDRHQLVALVDKAIAVRKTP